MANPNKNAVLVMEFAATISLTTLSLLLLDYDDAVLAEGWNPPFPCVLHIRPYVKPSSTTSAVIFTFYEYPRLVMLFFHRDL